MRGWFDHIHVSRLSREKHRVSGRAPEGAQLDQSESAVTQQCLSADDSCIQQNHTSICCLRLRRVRTELPILQISGRLPWSSREPRGLRRRCQFSKANGRSLFLTGSSPALPGDSLSLNAPSLAFQNVCCHNSCVSLRLSPVVLEFGHLDFVC